ncbi:MAG: hypothetical protein JNM82_09255 [Rhodocyclaceae bacterium]|nr:hypothetical protein [Rhodocyclaceae bacterium]
MGSMVLRGVLAFVVLVVLAAAAWVWLALSWSYSEGERAGYVQKFSRKGWLCKTWEGEIAMVTMPGAIPDRFEFSVRDDGVAAKINALAGKRVVLTYEQHKFVPSSCFGETEYFVVDARAIEDAPPAPVPSVAPPLLPSSPPVPQAPSVPAALPVPAAPAVPSAPPTR